MVINSPFRDQNAKNESVRKRKARSIWERNIPASIVHAWFNQVNFTMASAISSISFFPPISVRSQSQTVPTIASAFIIYVQSERRWNRLWFGSLFHQARSLIHIIARNSKRGTRVRVSADRSRWIPINIPVQSQPVSPPPVKTTHGPPNRSARDKSPVTSGWLRNNECGRMVRKGQSLAGIGFPASSLVGVRPVKYVLEYERPSICRLSVSLSSVPPLALLAHPDQRAFPQLVPD